MARSMKIVAPAKREEVTLVIEIDPLTVARGHRVLPHGGVHKSAKHLNRARNKANWRRQLDREAKSCRQRSPSPGPLV